MTHREIIRNNLNKSDWEITKDKCDSTRAHRRHLAANRKHETERKIYCTNVHLRIIGILITSVYNSVLSLLPLQEDDESYTLPDPEILLVYSLHFGQQCPPEWDDGSVPAETADRQKKKEHEKATSMLRRISFRNSRVLTLTPA